MTVGYSSFGRRLRHERMGFHGPSRLDICSGHLSGLDSCGAFYRLFLPAMEKTIKLLREKAPWCKVVVGGAVLTKEYAATIGADKYAKDAMATVRYAEEVMENL